MFNFIKIDEKFISGKKILFFQNRQQSSSKTRNTYKIIEKEEFMEFKEKFMDDFEMKKWKNNKISLFLILQFCNKK